MGGGDNELIIKTILDNTGFAKGSKQLMSAIKGLTNSIKSLFGRVVGVASIFGIISKAVSTFMSQNQQLTKQMNAAWTALGNALGPIITQIVGWVTKAVSYLVTLMKLLGFTSKTASQASKAAQAAAGSLQRTVAGFDELNKLSSGGGGGAGTLNDVDPDVFLEKLAELLKSHLWRQAGELIAKKINELIAKIKPKEIAEKLSNVIKDVLEFLIGFIGGLKTRQIGAKIREFFENIDWEGIKNEIFELLKTAWNKAMDLLWGLIAGDSEEEPPIIGSIRNLGNAVIDFVEKAIEFIDKLKPVWEWLWENVFEGIISGTIDLATAIVKSFTNTLDLLIKLINGDISFGEFIKGLDGIAAALTGIAVCLGILKGFKIADWIASLGGLSAELGTAASAAGGAATAAGEAAAAAAGAEGAFAGLGLSIGGVATALGGGALAALGLVPFILLDNKLSADYASEAFDGVENSAEGLAKKMNELAETASHYDECIYDTTGYTTEMGWSAQEASYAASAYEEGLSKLAQMLGITTEELKKQIEAAGGNVEAIEALKQHTGEAAAAADEAARFNNEATQSMSEGYGTLAANVERSTSEISGATESNTSEAAAALSSATSQMTSDVDSSFSQMEGDVALAMSDINSTVDNGFYNAVASASTWGSDLIANFVSGIRAAIPYLADNMAMVAQIVRNYIGFSEPKEGPLSDFHTYGPDMMDLYAKGIQSESAKVYSAVNDVAEGVADGLAQSPMALSAVASGSVVPYGVTGGVETSVAPNDGVSLTEVRDILTEIRNLLGTMEFVAQFGDLRAVAQRITTIQKQMERARG